MDDPAQFSDMELVEVPTKRKLGFWQRVGGGPLTFALLFHLIILLIGAIWIFQVIHVPEPKPDFMPGGGGGGGERGAETKVESKKRAQITPTTNVKRVFAEGATSNYQIPDPGDNFGEMSPLSSLTGGGMTGGLGGAGVGKGFGSGSGSGMGNGKGIGKLFGLIPDTMGKRCSKQDRLQRLRDNGGTPECEDAVVKALQWFKANQNPDGSWGTEHQPAMTGLVLLAYFGHCETPISSEFGESSFKAISYLVDLGMKNNGKMGSNVSAQPFCYEHGIATYALGEAYTFCKDLKVDVPNLKEVTEAAGQFIIDNQHENGGWSYGYAKTAGHTDTSVVGWQVQALKACSHTGIKYRSMMPAINKAMAYLGKMQNENGGFGYESPNSGGYFTLTGVGVLCHQMWGKGKSETRKGLRYLMKNTEFKFNEATGDLYGHYYESQAMMNAGGAEWKKYNRIFRDEVLKNQDTDGSWKVPGGGKPIRAPGSEKYVSNKIYRTALCTLMLEVYYRFLSTGGGGLDRKGI